MKPTTFLLASVIGAAQLLPLAVSAQPNDNMERASILFGAFITDRDSSTRLDSDSGEGTDLDLEDDVVAGGDGLLDRPARRSVAVAEVFGVLEQLTGGRQALEFLRGDETIMLSIDLVAASWAGGDRDGPAGIRQPAKQFVADGGLAGAGGAADDDQFAFPIRHGR